MDSDLLTVARTLAERGWLPGINYYPHCCIGLQVTTTCGVKIDATEADLHLAAIKRVREINGTVLFGWIVVDLLVHDPTGMKKERLYQEGAAQGDTLALLKCLLAASEASEGKETAHA